MNAILHMIVLALTLTLVGCSSVKEIRSDTIVKPDYIARLKEPISTWTGYDFFDGGSSGMTLIDSSGRRALIYWDYSGFHEESVKKVGHTWNGRPFGTIVLGNMEKGRPLVIPSEEATTLLRILDDVARRSHGGYKWYADDLRAKLNLPNKAPEPTPVSAQPASDAPVATATH